ncbi:MAG: hypothetical protein AAB486_03875 [Patescibacteria group bacterium]
MNIIGIDLGTATTGWGVLESEKGKWRSEACGAILTSKEKSLSERLADFPPGTAVDVVYSVGEDSWNGAARLSLNVKDMRSATPIV